jgi:hypothetical protein
MLTAGRPKIELPCPTTISRDIKICFRASRDRIAKLLCVCSCVYVTVDIGINTPSLGTPRTAALRNGHMVVYKPSGVCGMDRAP